MKKITITLLSLIASVSFAQTTLINWDGVNPAFDFPFDTNIVVPDLPNANPDLTGNTTANVRELQVQATAAGFTGYGGEFTAPVNLLNENLLSVYLRSDASVDFPVRFQFTDDPTGSRTQNPIEGDVNYTGGGAWQLVTVQLNYSSMDFGIDGGPLNLNEPIASPPVESNLPIPYTPNLDGEVNRYSIFPDFNNTITDGFSLWFDELIVEDSIALSTGDFAKDEVSVYPIPATLAVNIRGDISGNTASIYDLTGSLVSTSAITGNFNSVDVSALAKGVYFLQLENGSVLKFVK